MKHRLAERLRAVLRRLVPGVAATDAQQVATASYVRWLSRRWLRVLGRPGVLALGVLTALLPFYFSAIRPQEAHLDQVRHSIAQQGKRHTLAGKPEDGSPAAQLAEYYRFFPPMRTAPQWLEKMVGIAESSGLSLDQGEYQAVPDKVGKLVRLQMTLPVKGEYAQIRKFLSALSSEIPAMALEKVQFERQNIADPAVEARIRLVLYLGRPS